MIRQTDNTSQSGVHIHSDKRGAEQRNYAYSLCTLLTKSALDGGPQLDAQSSTSLNNT